MLTQHFLAVAADFMLRCGLRRGSGRSMLLISVDFKPRVRRIILSDTHREFSGPCISTEHLKSLILRPYNITY